MRIGFLAFHPGAVNTLTKVIDELRKHDDCELFFYPFLEYATKEWELENQVIFEDSIDFFNILRSDLDVLLYSSAADSVVENMIPIFCESNGITSISTVDVFWIDENEIKRRFKNKPNIIITPEKSVLEIIENLNWTDVKAYNLGNPHLEIQVEKEKKLKKNGIILNFISFPAGNEILCETDFKSKEIIKEISEIMLNYSEIKKMYISPHPREKIQSIEEFIESLDSELTLKLEINPYNSTKKCCENSDVIVGHSSTVLYEELLKGKNVIFYKNKKDFKEKLKNNEFQEINFTLPKNCSKNIVELILKNKRL